MDNATSTMDAVRGLLSLIVDSVGVAERYIPRREAVPQGQPIDPEFRSSIYAIQAACAQLCSLVARPSDVLANVSQHNSSLKKSKPNVLPLEIFCSKRHLVCFSAECLTDTFGSITSLLAFM
jgi:hypothetical protein